MATYSILDLFFGPSVKRYLGFDFAKRPVTEYVGDCVVEDIEVDNATRVTIQGLKGSAGVASIEATTLVQEFDAHTKHRTILGSTTTAGATPSEVPVCTLSDPTVASVHIRVTCTDSTQSTIGSFAANGLTFRAGGSASMLGAVAVLSSQTTGGGLDATISTTGNDVVLYLTGIAATNLRWAYEVSIQRVVF